MFSKSIIDSDLFLDMPATTQMLYFHLAMRADDDGFINNPKRIMRMVGSSEDDMKILIAKQFIIPFESGIVVIRHWKIHNYIRSDRYKPSVHEEKNQLKFEGNLVYQLDTVCQSTGIPEVSEVGALGKDRLDKDRIDNIYSQENDSKQEENHLKNQSHSQKNSEIYAVIVSYLNEKAGTNYHISGKTTQRHINARLVEGYTVDDFKKVIDNKCADWMGTEWEKFLRPSTLFGTKFEDYLNQKMQSKKPSKNEISKSSDDEIFKSLIYNIQE